MPTAPARPMPMKAVGIAAPASETLLLLSELEPELPELEPEPEPLVVEEPEPVLVEVEPDRLELRLELELPELVLLPPMKVPFGATETGTVPLPPPMRVPVPRTPGAVVMGVLEVALERPALLASEDAAEVREERPARSVGTR